MPWFALFFACTAFARGFDRPDPPGLLEFRSVELRRVSPAPVLIPQTCDAAFRARIEPAILRSWEQCRRVGQAEPSPCQRRLFEQCTSLVQELQRREADACSRMAAESDALQALKTGLDQRQAQAEAALLHRQAEQAVRKVASGLEADRHALRFRSEQSRLSLSSASCATSSSSPQYSGIEGALQGELRELQGALRGAESERKATAGELGRLAAVAERNEREMKSLSGVVAPPASAASAASPPPAPALSVVPEEPRKKIPWVPILALGVPAAILTGVLLSRAGKGGGSGGAGAPEPGGPEPGGVASDPEPGFEPPTPEPAPADPGSAELSAWKVQLDPGFTDRQKLIIAEGFRRMPACHRHKLRNLKVVSGRLPRRARSCVAGQFVFGSDRVTLSPSCVVSVGVTVHEFFHVIGNRNGNSLHRSYSGVARQNPGCPVSSYGGTNFYEDFAEAGRILQVPESGERNRGACVDRRLAGLRQLLADCRQPPP